MYAMQYEITLPADYDMQIIRQRVATRGSRTDDFPGLGLKAYVVRERGGDDSPVNQYAPFYLWCDIGAMSRFLVGGGGFQGIIADFGRPTVSHWAGIASQPGPARAIGPRAASRRIQPVAAGDDPAALIQQAIDDLHQQAQDPSVHTTALAVDPRHWQLARFTLWEQAVPATDTSTERYEVLHVSAPHLSAIPAGRHW